MQLANTIIGALGDVLVLIALIVAVRALTTANGERADVQGAEDAAVQARREAADREIEANKLAAQTARDAALRAQDAAERDEAAAMAADLRAQEAAQRDLDTAQRQLGFEEIADLERRRDRVYRIGQLVEDLFWRVHESDQELDRPQWMPLRNNLRHQLIGLTAALPECTRIVDAGTAAQADGICVNARVEIEAELTGIEDSLADARSVLLETLRI
jgi:hypothetical protein